jgi:hypothetical protein
MVLFTNTAGKGVRGVLLNSVHGTERQSGLSKSWLIYRNNKHTAAKRNKHSAFTKYIDDVISGTYYTTQ